MICAPSSGRAFTPSATSSVAMIWHEWSASSAIPRSASLAAVAWRWICPQRSRQRSGDAEVEVADTIDECTGCRPAAVFQPPCPRRAANATSWCCGERRRADDHRPGRRRAQHRRSARHDRRPDRSIRATRRGHQRVRRAGSDRGARRRGGRHRRELRTRDGGQGCGSPRRTAGNTGAVALHRSTPAQQGEGDRPVGRRAVADDRPASTWPARWPTGTRERPCWYR